MRKTAISTGVLGLVLMIAAGLMAWWITPSYIARMPANYNTTRTYDATIRTLFDPAALAAGNLASAIKTGLPATVAEAVKVQQTSGNTALVQDTRNITVAGRLAGQTVSPYALDRQTLAATSSHPGNWSVIPAQGLTVSWPLGAKQQNYTGWVYQTYATTALKYVKEVQQGGINTYEYQATVPATPVKPVMSYTYHATPATLSAAVNDANNGSSTISTWGVTVPITAAAVGFVLVILAAFLWMRGSGRGRPTGMPHRERHPAPAGGSR